VIMARKRTQAAKPTAKANGRTRPVHLPQKIISGGQTGVDRAGLEVAIALGIEHGGWCPRGRLAEDGSIPSRYELVENDSTDYTVRTRQNVVDSDATLILFEQRLSGGTMLTRRIASELGKPFLCIRIHQDVEVEIASWLIETKPASLNVAGPRESSSPGIESRAMEMLMRVFAS